ncbi:uncharacterized protein LOC125556785 isoform X2 [Nematostella vectensis]|uniref:uncharacterized protein LOC116616182 isoform X2 n=1 Tax=Nematostella vectensis TaxID=45351 RepID=UPI001390131E|nr:uncharacterized protein LOC116616182 isoform X2 [Nematostella vectensis]XP_048584791.1 uncharacterized protein LOC125556785 isoform X2 [Nematostella vectensis]
MVDYSSIQLQALKQARMTGKRDKPQTPNKKIVPRLKAFPECGTNCPTACRSCKNENCSYIFAKKVKSNHDAIEKKGTTNPTNQKDMMYYRVPAQPHCAPCADKRVYAEPPYRIWNLCV